MSVITRLKQRFEEGAQCGWLYRVAIGEHRFHIRVFDDIPARAIVLEPKNARQTPFIQNVVRFLLSEGYSDIQLYFAPGDLYRTVNPDTLEFV